MIQFKELSRHGDPIVLDEALRREIHGYPEEVGAESIALEVASSFGAINVEPNPNVMDKAMALHTCHVSNAPWTDLACFEKVVHALNGFIPDFTVIEASAPAEIALAVVTMARLRPKMKFSESVRAYIRGCMQEYGVVCFPDILKFAEESYDIKELTKLCSDVRAHPDFQKIMAGDKPFSGGESLVEVQLQKLSVIGEYLKGELNAEPSKSSGAPTGSVGK